MLKRVIVLVGILTLVAVMAVIGFKIFFDRQSQFGALKIDSSPQATVFIDDKHAGKTPFEEKKIGIGKHTVKLVPQKTAADTAAFQTEINIQPEVMTVINYQFDQTDLDSSSEILTLEQLDSKEKIELALLSNPDGVIIKIDGQQVGVSPEIIKDIGVGEHELIMEKEGYRLKRIMIKTIAGYRLTINAKLAKEKEAIKTVEEKEATPSAQLKTTAKPQVEILETPTGWLRVRSLPSTAASESAKVNPGEIFPFLEEQSGWFKIEYQPNQSGWISSRYAKKLSPE